MQSYRLAAAVVGLLLIPVWAKGADGEGTDAAEKEVSAKAASVHDFTVQGIDGKPVKLAQFEGDVLLIVNVASKCGLTERNYAKLQPLYEKYRKQGFRVLAFPANNFGGQEPGSNAEIKEFCRTKHAVTFDLLAKVSVKGEDKCPLYRFLTEQTASPIAGEVPWNFQKYLVGRDGQVLAKYHPRVDPDDAKLVGDIEEALRAPRRGEDTEADGA